MEDFKKITYFWKSDICVAKSHRYIWNFCEYFTVAYKRKRLTSDVKRVYINFDFLFGPPSLWEQSSSLPCQGMVSSKMKTVVADIPLFYKLFWGSMCSTSICITTIPIFLLGSSLVVYQIFMSYIKCRSKKKVFKYLHISTCLLVNNGLVMFESILIFFCFKRTLQTNKQKFSHYLLLSRQII